MYFKYKTLKSDVKVIYYSFIFFNTNFGKLGNFKTYYIRIKTIQLKQITK